MPRTVYVLGPNGEILAFEPVSLVASWAEATDEIICRTAAGVFIGLGLLTPEILQTARFEVRSGEARPATGSGDDLPGAPGPTI